MLHPALAMALIMAVAPLATAQTPKSGGSLSVMLREDLPQGFAIHESSTYSTSFPALPCFNNLVFFDPAKPTESMDTIVGDLAERWSWQDNYKNLVFFLRKDVKWHDGKPFTSKDVKFTFDMLARRRTRRPSSASTPARTGTRTSSTSRRPIRIRWCSA
jgi:peptide/nickel transport system substrate-binding protein